MGILAFDKVDLPLPMPALQLLLARYRFVHGFELFEADQTIDPVSGCETLHLAGSVLVKPADQIRGDANVQRSICATCEDVDARLFHGRLACEGMDAETSSA